MAQNLFKTIRKSYFVHLLCSALLSNLMIFSQPIQMMLGQGKMINRENYVAARIQDQNREELQPLVEESNSYLRGTSSPVSFRSIETSGKIGKKSDSEPEDPSDNFFKVILPQDINLNRYDAVLVYELYGLQGASETTKSINNRASYGGKVIHKTEKWSIVKEYLPAIQLKAGANDIFFNRRTEENYQYEVRNLKIELKEKKVTDIRAEAIADKNDGLYIVGTVSGNIPSVSIAGVSVAVEDGVFEHHITNVPKSDKQVMISYASKDGNKILHLPIQYHSNPILSFGNSSLSNPSKIIRFDELQMGSLFYEGIRVEIANKSSLSTQSKILVQGLDFKDVRLLQSEAENVTYGKFPGYRISKANLPDSTVTKLHLKYDETKIPDGYTAEDIKTFYFDSNARAWKELAVDSLDTQKKEIISTTFSEGTDYINGIIKVPESPETGSFAPTAMTDIKYADPASGVVSISPPSPNNSGTLNTSFPVKLPQGRNGMSPSLAVTYNSEAGNGWMGIGWNLSTQAITLNTTWGAPLYDVGKETELYSMNGSDLVLQLNNGEYGNPHRDADIPRYPERIFYERKEGSYQMIVRHGSSPINYWWEVTDKQGNKTFYGGYNGLIENAVLRTPAGQIGHWAITRTQDPFGNYIEYNYSNIDATLSGSTVAVKKFYIDNIRYTRNSAVPNYYQVDFKRNSYTVQDGSEGLLYNPRTDISTNARNGYIQLTDDLLTEIHISLVKQDAPTLIRKYRFNYKEYAFSKRQLDKIAEFDKDGALFYSNTMEYYNEIGSQNIISGVETSWGSAGNDAVSPALASLAGSNGNLIPNGSPLGASTGSGFSAGLRVGAGFGVRTNSTASTGGASMSYSSNNQNTRISFLDINGDGLPDKIYDSNGSLAYRPSYRNGTAVGFGDLVPITGQNSLSRTKSKTTGYGFDFNVLGLLGAGKSFSTTRSETDSYFIDRNGDGLPDVVSGGRILFNTTTGTNNLQTQFQAGIAGTENTIEPGAISSDMIQYLKLQTMDELRDENPQFDHVTIWQAPYTGTVNVAGTAILADKNIYEGKENKFRLTLEKSANGSNTTATIGAPVELQTKDQAVNFTRQAISVNKGEILFFRSHNMNHGYGGEVEWNPIITYTATVSPITPFVNQKDEHGKLLNVFNVNEDYAINNGGNTPVKDADSNVNIDFNVSQATGFAQYTFSDDIRFVVKKITTNIQTGDSSTQEWSRTFNHANGSIGAVIATNPAIPVTNIPVSQPNNYSISFEFYAESNSNVDWGKVRWRPILTGNASGTSYPAVNYITFDDNVNQASYAISGQVLPEPVINPLVSGDGAKNMLVFQHDMFEANQKNWLQQLQLTATELPAKVSWVIKEDRGGGIVTAVSSKFFYIQRNSQGTIVFTRSTNISDVINPALVSDYPYFQFFRSKAQIKSVRDNGGNYYSAFYISNSRIGAGNPSSITLSIAPTETANYPAFSKVLGGAFMVCNPTFFGQSFRRWGQFLYNGGIKFARSPEGEIDTNSTPQNYGNANIDMAIFNFEVQAQTVNAPGYDPETDQANYTSLRFAFYDQDNENQKYKNASIKEAIYGFSNNRLTSKIGRFAEANTHLLYIDPLTITQPGNTFAGLRIRSLSKGSAVSGNAVYAAGTLSKGKSEVINQYLDLNGDRYPDFVTGARIQYTNMRGALHEKFTDPQFVSGEQSEDKTLGVSIPIAPNSTASSNSPTSDNKTNTNTNSGLNTGDGKSFNAREWSDMNGDGLPDKVQINENNVIVNLNTGYGFTSDIIWGTNLPDLLTSERGNGSLGTNLNIGSSFAVGFGMATSTANIKTVLIDVNGDQLPDLVVKQGTSSFKYYLNNGKGFDIDSPKVFYDGANIEEDKSYSGNLFGTFTSGFTIPLTFIILKVVFTPTAGTNADYNEKRVNVQDIDGDGLPDVIYNSGNNITAKLNTIKKTHLLKKVNTALGGSWSVEYVRDGNTYDMPHSKWVMTKIQTNDGFAADNSLKPDNTFAAIAYENPKYDRRERAFFGYEKVIIKEMETATSTVPYRTLVKSFHTDNYYLNGAEKATAIHIGNMGQLLSEEKITYNILNGGGQTSLSQNASNNFGQSLSVLDKWRLFVTVARTESTSFENGQSLTAIKDFKEYDYNGNLKKIIDYGEGPEDAYRTEIDYHSAVSGLTNGIGFPSKIKVLKDSSNQLMRQRKSEYANGKPTKIETMLNQQDTAVLNLEYDNFGNLSTIRNPSNTNENGDEFQTNLEYESELFTYPNTISNSFGEYSNTWYEYLFGIPIFTTDVNGQSMRTRIDAKGRTMEITGPNELALENGNGNPNANGNAWTIRMEYKPSFIAVASGAANPSNSQHHAITRHFDPEYATGINTSNQLLTVSIVDGFGQPVQVKKTHRTGTVNKWMLSPFEQKDAFGRTLKSYQPGVQSSSFTLNAADIGYFYSSTLLADPIEMSYDEKDRVKTVQQPATSGNASISYAIEAGMFVQQSTNELNQTQNSFTDIRGRNRKTVQNGQITTTFEYNAINELKQVINNEGFATNYLYDLAGRKTEVQHPDRGVVTFKYDKASRMTEQSTSNLLLLGGQKIKYKYDFGRLVAIEYPDVAQNNVTYKYGTLSDNFAVAEKAVGRLLEQKDATGVQVFGYGRMGEVTKNLRSVAVAGYQSYWFYTKWKYDSWNRVKEITYPDQEIVKYQYNTAGSLERISSQMNGIDQSLVQDIISSITYNDFGERAMITHGNSTVTRYTYDTRHRLNTLKHDFNAFNIQKDYGYDALSNITSIATNTPSSALPAAGKIGGPVNHSYGYDSFNRLITADGNYTGANDSSNPYLAQRYSLAMEYNSDHTIKTKTQAQFQGSVSGYGANPANEVPVYKNSYKLEYSGYGTGAYVAGTNYGYQQPHAVRNITENPTWIDVAVDDPRIRTKEISYDANGNQTEIKEKVGEVKTSLRQNLWDAENRIRAVNLKPDDNTNHPIAIYTYNVGGERTVRYNYDHIGTFSNEQKVGQVSKDNVMLYPSGLLMGKAYHNKDKDRIDRIRYTKHYYVGSERISAKTGTVIDLGMFPLDLLGSELPQLNVQDIRNKSKTIAFETAPEEIYKVHSLFNVAPPTLDPIDELTKIDFRHDQKMLDIFYFHPDHLGSSSYITNFDGVISQHMEYLPFGETLVDEHLNSRNSPFKYNGKEFDEETGNYYYGARYYDPKWSLWLSVDPLAEKYYDWNPYNYCLQNPINFIDPDGLKPLDNYRLNKNGTLTFLKKTNDKYDKIYNSNFSQVLTVNKSFVSLNSNVDTFGSFEERIRGKEDSNYLYGSDYKKGMSIFKFFADNSDVEFSYKEFSSNNGEFGVLTTTHEERTISSDLALISSILNNDSSAKLKSHTHDHPQKADVLNYPAWPSGFSGTSLEAVNNSANHKAFGDRGFYQALKSEYGSSRIPENFNLYVPELPQFKIIYNGDRMIRD